MWLVVWFGRLLRRRRSERDTGPMCRNWPTKGRQTSTMRSTSGASKRCRWC